MAKDWKPEAGILWPILVERAKIRKTYTYGEVAPKIGLHHRPVKYALDPIQNYCKENKIPILTAVVVNQDTGEPGDGFLGGDIKEVYEFDWDAIPNPFHKEVSIDEFIRFIRSWVGDGVKLKTLKQQKPFHVEVGDDYISFTPEGTGIPRHSRFDPYIVDYLDIYNRGARKTNDYSNSENKKLNASYFLAIMEEYEKPQNQILRSAENQPLAKDLETEKETIVKARKGQGKFRDDVLTCWSNACAVTQFGKSKLLRASHIKPWKESDNRERLDQYNGLLLTPNLDALFDGGWITFDEGGKIKISPEISATELAKLGVDASMKLRKIHLQNEKFLQFHRTKIFRA